MSGVKPEDKQDNKSVTLSGGKAKKTKKTTKKTVKKPATKTVKKPATKKTVKKAKK